ncbi:MAG: LysR family transcriptional regulator [Flexilinea sp.]|nr:LysR family transcriptional regulator [Flexilinea sp.]
MVDTYLLEQLSAVYECGTLSAASQKLHLTQPSLSRSMQKLEAILALKLFDRHKNRITLNDNGVLAAECAKQILAEEQLMINRVREHDRSKRMINVGTIAPGPMFELSPLLSSIYPDKTISTESRQKEELINGLYEGTYGCDFDISALICEIRRCSCFRYWSSG